VIQKKRILGVFITIIIVLGGYFRLSQIQTREIHGDESIYYSVSVQNSIQQIISISHNFKDHGIAYFLFLKANQAFIQDIPTLRYTNVGLYVVSALLLFVTLNSLGLKSYALLGLFIFSTHWHFIQISTVLSPYNLVIPLALSSIFLLVHIMRNAKTSVYIDVLFAFATALSMYADYSFFYLFYLYISIIGITREKKLIRPYLFTLIFVMPGLIQFFWNFQHISGLFSRVPDVVQLTFKTFLLETARLMVFTPAPWVGLILFITIIGGLVMFGVRSNNKLSRQIVFSILLTLLSSLSTLYLVHQFIFPLFLPRSFWVFHLLITLCIVFLVQYISTRPFITLPALIILSMHLSGITIDTYTNHYSLSGSIESSSLITLMSKHPSPKKIVFYDPIFTCQPFISYYFSYEYPQSDKYSKEIKYILAHNPVIIHLYHSVNIENSLIPWEGDPSAAIVFCDTIENRLPIAGSVYQMKNNVFELVHL